MKTLTLLLSAVLSLPLGAFAGGGGIVGSNSGGSGNGGHGGKGQRGGIVPRPRVVIKMKHVRIPRPQTIREPSHIVNDRRTIDFPKHDDKGKAIAIAPAQLPPANHGVVVGVGPRNTGIVPIIKQRQVVEITPRTYYWHTDNGIRYAHYYMDGVHWYGFYHGANFYWTRYWADRWWWFDVRFNRWVFWNAGYWWWPGPAGAMYVYVNDNYYPYETTGVVTVVQPEVHAPPPAAPAVGEGKPWISPDGNRMVRLVGGDSEAFLYDKSQANEEFMKYLGKGVAKVRFSGGKDGKPLRILLEFKDDSFAMYDAEGEPLDAAPTVAAPPPPVPDDGGQAQNPNPPSPPPAPPQ
jgi:hypothetical protein